MPIPNIENAVEEFKTHGFVTLPGLLAKQQVAEILEQVRSVFAEAIAATGSQTGTLDQCYITLKDASPGLKSHCYDVLGQLDAIVRACTCEAVREFGRRLFGGPVILEAPQVRIADPSNDRFYPLHQELGLLSHSNFTAWTPLVPLNGDAGGLAVVRGSHKMGLLPHRHFPEFSNYHGVSQELLSKMKVERVVPEVGEAVLFHPFLVHGSLDNKSPRVTWTLITRYNNLSDAPYLHDADAPRRISRPPEAKH